MTDNIVQVTNSGNSDRPFAVEGDTFTDFPSAANRACDNQKNNCAQMANSNNNAGFDVGDCDQQNSKLLMEIMMREAAVHSTHSAPCTLSFANSTLFFHRGPDYTKAI